MKNSVARHALIGGSLICGYHAIIDYMRHHEEANPRTAFFDHLTATTIMGTVTGAFFVGRPYHLFLCTFFSAVLVAPTVWWFKKAATFGANRQAPNIFYMNDCTDEEIERYRHQDMIEELAEEMRISNGYGYATRKDPGFF